MNDEVSEFDIRCISGFRTRNELEIQILWFQILPEPMNFSFHSHLLSAGTLTAFKACFKLEPKHWTSRFHVRMAVYDFYRNRK